MGDVEYLALVLSQTAVVAFMLWDRRAERREMAAERAMLLQRIQAPESAVVEHVMSDRPSSPMPMRWDNDEDFHSSREEMAEILGRSQQ